MKGHVNNNRGPFFISGFKKSCFAKIYFFTKLSKSNNGKRKENPLICAQIAEN
jgi:hypothetical protein